MDKKYEMNMSEGPFLQKILKFSFPLIASGVLQLLFNAMDIIVVGQYEGQTALAAIGSTSALINMLINIFVGISIGANVVVAHEYGARREKDLSTAIHTAITISFVAGIVMTVVGIVFSAPLLRLMGSPEDVLPLASLYMKIYFGGITANMVYNFGAAILRAVGDTKHPLYYLTIAGVINIVLNLILVIVFHLGVAGVGIATVLSQCVSAVLVLRLLMRTEGIFRLDLKKLGIDKRLTVRSIKIGLPAGIQGSLFAISNVLIQSSINSFGSVIMAGSTAAGNLEGFIYTAMNAFHQSAVSFISQSVGAKKYSNIKKIMVICILCVIVVGGGMGGLSILFASQLLGIYSSNPEVIQYGFVRLSTIASIYFLCGIMDVLVGGIRGMGNSVVPMIISLVGVCGLRIVWIYSVFAVNRSLYVLFLSYPVTWCVTATIQFICFIIVYKKLRRQMPSVQISD